MTNKEVYKQIKKSYTYNVYTPYESYIYNKGIIDCLEYLKIGIDISNCHALNCSLLNGRIEFY